MATENLLGRFLGWLGGRPNRVPKAIESPQEVVPARQNREESRPADVLSFFVDGPRVQDYAQVGLSVNLWIPKVNPEKVHIYHRDGPGGCLGIVPSQYASLIIAHLVNGLDYEAQVEERTDTTCKIRCRLISREETEQRREERKISLRRELTKAYVPKKPITLVLGTKTRDAVKVGDKLRIEFDDLDSYLPESSQRGPYSCQWCLTFRDQSGKTVGTLEHDKATIQKILKAHFNSYVLDIEVVETFSHLDHSAEKERSNWNGYPIKLVIRPIKNNSTSAN
jgi:hypothetical protein